MIQNSIWNEKYRVNNPEEFICSDQLKRDIQKYIDENDIPHLLLAGQAGVGKTTLAKLLVSNMDCDSLIINASDENGIDIIREKVKNFASSASFSPIKIIILDEADFLTKEAQSALRNIIETFSKNTRFIFTCNYLEKIIEPIQSRCVSYKLNPPTKGLVAARLASILENEQVKYNLEDVAKIVNESYPDIRKSINLIQQFNYKGELVLEKIIRSDYINQILDLLSSNNKNVGVEIRQILVDSDIKDYQELYRALYEKYINNPSIIVTIAEYQFKHTFVIDKEINFMACVIKMLPELQNLYKKQING